MRSTDPFTPARGATLEVVSDVPARIGVDGSALYQWTPRTLTLDGSPSSVAAYQ